LGPEGSVGVGLFKTFDPTPKPQTAKDRAERGPPINCQ
jgi:hypothetical protein